MGRKRAFRRERPSAGMKRWDVVKLQGSIMDAKGRVTARGKYLNGEVAGVLGCGRQCV